MIISYYSKKKEKYLTKKIEEIKIQLEGGGSISLSSSYDKRGVEVRTSTEGQGQLVWRAHLPSMLVLETAAYSWSERPTVNKDTEIRRTK